MPEFFYDLFPSAGEGYDATVRGMAYREPDVLFDELRSALPATLVDSVLDVGCGTGLLGALLRPFARRLIGIDGSEKMLGEARKKGLYDALIVGDFCTSSQLGNGAYDLIVAAGVFLFYADLTVPLRTASSAVKKDGLIAFSIDASAATGVEQNPRSNLMFMHPKAEVARCCAAAGFELLSIKEAVGRNRFGTDEPISCYFAVAHAGCRG